MAVKKTTTNKRKIRTDSIQFALRAEEGKFWDGRARRLKRYGMPLPWTVGFSKEPIFWGSAKAAMKQWQKYEMERLCGEPIPQLNLVKYEMTAVEIGQTTPTASFYVTVFERIKRAYNQAEFALVFEKLMTETGGDEEKTREYKYAFRRRGKAKEIIAETFPDAVSYGYFTLVKTESDLVMARMVLGANLVDHYEMAPLYDINMPLAQIRARN